jgi:hypothetical protein
MRSNGYSGYASMLTSTLLSLNKVGYSFMALRFLHLKGKIYIFYNSKLRRTGAAIRGDVEAAFFHI